MFPWSNFLEEISSLSHSIVYLYVFALIAEEGFLVILAIPWNSAFKWVYLPFSPLLFTSLLFRAICKASSDSHFAFLHFFFLGWSLLHSNKSLHLPTNQYSNTIPKGYFYFLLIFGGRGVCLLISLGKITFKPFLVHMERMNAPKPLSSRRSREAWLIW